MEIFRRSAVSDAGVGSRWIQAKYQNGSLSALQTYLENPEDTAPRERRSAV
jgi:hypothetical protein